MVQLVAHTVHNELAFHAVLYDDHEVGSCIGGFTREGLLYGEFVWFQWNAILKVKHIKRGPHRVSHFSHDASDHMIERVVEEYAADPMAFVYQRADSFSRNVPLARRPLYLVADVLKFHESVEE